MSGLCWRATPKIVGYMSSKPVRTGGKVKSSFSQPLEVTPCCSGPEPETIEAQLVLLEVGSTPRAFKV